MIDVNRHIFAGVKVQAAVVAFAAVDKKFMFAHFITVRVCCYVNQLLISKVITIPNRVTDTGSFNCSPTAHQSSFGLQEFQ